MNQIESAVRDIRITNEAKLLLQLSGGSIRSQKKFKGIYAIVQSLFPDIFIAKWDGFFFSLWSSELSDALMSLCNDGDCMQALWTRPKVSDPIHHIYFLANNRQKIDLSWMQLRRYRKLHSTVLSWSLLPSAFTISCLLLIEAFNEYFFRENEKLWFKGVDHIPPMELRDSLKKLENTFSEMGIKPLSQDLLEIEKMYTAHEGVNSYMFLLFYLNKKEREKVFNFYNRFTRQGSFELVRINDTDSFKVTIEKEKIRGSYEYLNLSNEKNQRFLTIYLDIVNSANFSKLLDGYFERIREEMPRNSIDYPSMEEWFKKQKKTLKELDKETKEMALKKARENIRLLQKYKDIIAWRYETIMGGLESLASPTKNRRILFSFMPEDSEAYLDAFPRRDGTGICIEFDKDYFHEFIQEHEPYRKTYDGGILSHICHFFQPNEVCKLIKIRKENEFQKTGGPILVFEKKNEGKNGNKV